MTNDGLKTHPAAELFPVMLGERFDALVTDIRERGLLEPIVLTNGLILDGRNRYLACLEIGVEPTVEEWNGEGTPEGYVISKNLQRRHLTESERAMIAAKLATMKRGDAASQRDEGEISPSSLKEVADMLNINRSTVIYAKKVLSDGTLEDIAAVETGNAAVSTVAKKIKQREKEAAGAPPLETDGSLRSGTRLAVPEGMTAEQACRKVMGLENKGVDAETAAKEIGLAITSYRKLRDIVALSDRTDLSEKDQASVKRALDDMNKRQQIQQPYQLVTDLVCRIWGPSKNRSQSREKDERRRIEGFEKAYFVVVQTCAATEKISIPHLSSARVEEIGSELKEAEKYIRQFRNKIMEIRQ